MARTLRAGAIRESSWPLKLLIYMSTPDSNRVIFHECANGIWGSGDGMLSDRTCFDRFKRGVGRLKADGSLNRLRKLCGVGCRQHDVESVGVMLSESAGGMRIHYVSVTSAHRVAENVSVSKFSKR